MLGTLQQFFQLFLQNLICPLLLLNVVLVSLSVCLLLLFVLDLHVSDLVLQFLNLFFQLSGLSFQVADLVLHIFLFLFGLECLSHTEGDRALVQGLVSLDGLYHIIYTDLISSLTLTSRRPLSAQLIVICLMSSSKHWLYSS